MAGADKPEYPPLLSVGFHPFDSLQRLCVDHFPRSVTRARLMANLEGIISRLNQAAMKAELWIDGSFLTEKLNPEDVDLVVCVDGRDSASFDVAQRAALDWVQTGNLWERYGCDAYAFVRNRRPEDEWIYAYWLRQFGFSRANEMKGLAVVRLPYLLK
jgi:hypothetical protein